MRIGLIGLGQMGSGMARSIMGLPRVLASVSLLHRRRFEGGRRDLHGPKEGNQKIVPAPRVQRACVAHPRSDPRGSSHMANQRAGPISTTKACSAAIFPSWKRQTSQYA